MGNEVTEKLVLFLQNLRVLTFPGSEIHIRERTVYHNGTAIPLTHYEFFTLLYLARHLSCVITRDLNIVVVT